jgi:hypothetical protein
VQPVEEHNHPGNSRALFAFDEVISLGREEVTVAQVRQNTDMESPTKRSSTR